MFGTIQKAIKTDNAVVLTAGKCNIVIRSKEYNNLFADPIEGIIGKVIKCIKTFDRKMMILFFKDGSKYIIQILVDDRHLGEDEMIYIPTYYHVENWKV